MNLVHVLLLDLPLIGVFALYIGMLFLERLGTEYLIPQLELARFTEEKAERDLTYYHRICDHDDQTAFDTSEFVVTTETTADQAVDLMLRHGVAAIPDLITRETANELRDFILEENEISKDLIYVIENSNRWSFRMTVDQHPSVPKALKEVLSKPKLKEILEKIMGYDPAVIEFTAITSAYGAVGQYWHQDVVPEGNGAKYSRHFVPSYSLFIPLQNTTAAMGATGICPGTHMCADGASQFCEETAFQVSGKDDNWPLGTGALVNQQTTHRGEGHNDPNGPHRVVFILTFAPRPLTRPFTVETRTIGTGGSYSLHFSQWGHTLADFQNPGKRMRQPWRTLRSFGLYKPSGNQWGWDYVTVSISRLANGDTGFTYDDLEEFIDNGAFKWLPQWLHGELHPEDETSMAWIFYLQSILKKCIDSSKIAHRAAVSLYIALTFSMALLSKSHARGSIFFRTMTQVVILHLLVLLCAWWTYETIANSTWGHNIKLRRTFTLPETPAQISSPPATLPTREDILVFDSMQSEYFSSFSMVLEVAHPGNKAWHEIVSKLSAGYIFMTPLLQYQIQTSIMFQARQQNRRLLMKNIEGSWAEASVDSFLLFCHKCAMKKSNKYVGAVIEHLDFLSTESRYGYWRDTALHRRFIPLLLSSVRDSILKNREKLNVPIATMGVQRPILMVHSFLPIVATPTPFMHARHVFPLEPIDDELYSVKWLAEGDLVEAIIDDVEEEWYRGHTLHASANRMVWDVEFDDGDLQSDLQPGFAIRRYVPYQIDELVEVRVDESNYEIGHIIRVHSLNDTFDIALEENEKVMSSVHPMDLRRRVNGGFVEFDVGDRVLAQFPDAGTDYYPGTVTSIYPGAVTIEYDDGDVIDRLPISMVIANLHE